MTATNPNDLKLSNGKGTPTKPCLQSKAALVHAHTHGYLTPNLLGSIFTDRPCWQNQIVNIIGIQANDSIPAGRSDLFERLDAMMPRVIAATVRTNPDVEHRVNVRLLCWLAREVLHLTRPEDRAACENAIETRERWLVGDATKQDCRDAATWAAGAAWAAWAAGAAGAAGAAIDDGWIDALKTQGLLVDLKP